MRKSSAFFVVKAVAVAAAAAGCIPAMAETPFGLVLSETLTYDTNVLRTNDDKRSDLTSSTGAKVFFDKDYGRQNYHASAMGVFQRYKNNKDFDNNGYEISAGASTGIGANGLASLDHTRTRTQQDFGEQGLNRYRERIDSQSTVLAGRYGLYGKWGLTGEASLGRVFYEEREDLDQESQGLRLGIRYDPSDLLNFDVGYKKSDIDYKKRTILYSREDSIGIGRLGIGDFVDRDDVNVISNWTITGLSKLTSQVGWTRERHDKDRLRDFSGLTGRLNWSFTPRGKMSYGLVFSRDTNNAGGQTVSGDFGYGLPNAETQKRLITSLTATAAWQATAKISANASLQLRRLEEERREYVVINPDINPKNESSKGSYRSLSLGLKYAPQRYLAFNCMVSSYKRSDTVLSIGFSGESASCTASFVID